MVKGAANVWMPVEDIERALDFYRNTLGFLVIKQDGSWAEVDANALNIGLNSREPEGVQDGGGPVVTFQPEAGLEAAAEDLKSKGADPQRGSLSTSGPALRRSRTARATTSNATKRRAVEPHPKR